MSIKVTRYPIDPSAGRLVINSAKAAGRFLMARKKFVGREAEALRLKICQSCRYWQPEARAGMGKCRHHACGCTRFKLKVASEACPMGKWSRVG